ncbi:peptidase S8/S53 domain-containing protein [Lactarius quietus]|nr:peptidase S8/S53 domain-containing protein [Lactarius quietus]
MRCLQLSAFFVLTLVPPGCLTTLVSSRWDNLKVKHSWTTIPENWESLGHPPADTTIDLHIALRPHRENALIEALDEVSSPRHPKHALFTTPPLHHEQVAALVMPHPDTLELVHSWLKYNGVLPSSVSMTHGGGWLTLTGVSVSKANDLLGASYQLYRHTKTNETILRTVGYSLPAALHLHVRTVAPTTFFASSRMLRQTPRKLFNGTTAEVALGELVAALLGRNDDDNPQFPVPVKPSFLRWFTNSESYVPAATDRNKIGIAGYDNQYPSPTDLAKFMNNFYAPGTQATFSVVLVNNGRYNPNAPGIEGNVDIQYTSAMAYPTQITYYNTGKGPLGKHDPYLSWLYYILAQSSIPQTITTSYANLEKDCPLDYAIVVCDLFAQLGARGVSVLFSSGDYGVGPGDCVADGDVRFIPTFPASCPYVTSVGGTWDNPEEAPELSGGGFSDYFLRPDYQDVVVPKFLENLGYEYLGLYNPLGRGIPDIAVQSSYIAIILDGKDDLVEGTSIATPVRIISLLNDFRLSQNMPPLGFLNPWLYGIARAGMNDVTRGTNPVAILRDSQPSLDGIPCVIPDLFHLLFGVG